jgi:hypothetical protein
MARQSPGSQMAGRAYLGMNDPFAFGGGTAMTNDRVQAPTPAQLKELADDLGFDLDEAELAAFGELIGPSIDAYNAVDRMAQELPR